jgi:serine/threonine-protein kinase
MGVVVEAQHIGLGQHFALKIMRPEFAASPAAVLRFEREARAAGQLRSPHTVRIFDVDKGDDGLPYMVMELLEGHDLAIEVRERPDLPTEELVDWIIQVCAAIGEAHELGVVHRDIKPSNIFICADGATRIAKVLDFGISKLTTIQSVTAENTSLGTPHYMSPEQLRSAKGVDLRSDLWSLGVVLYRILAGRFPFDGETPSALTIAIATALPVDFAILRPDLPAELSAAIMKALAKDVAERFSSAAEFAAALMPFGTGVQPLPLRGTARDRNPASRQSLRDILGDAHSAPPPGPAGPTSSDGQGRWYSHPSEPPPPQATPSPHTPDGAVTLRRPSGLTALTRGDTPSAREDRSLPDSKTHAPIVSGTPTSHSAAPQKGWGGKIIAAVVVAGALAIMGLRFLNAGPPAPPPPVAARPPTPPVVARASAPTPVEAEPSAPPPSASSLVVAAPLPSASAAVPSLSKPHHHGGKAPAASASAPPEEPPPLHL